MKIRRRQDANFLRSDEREDVIASLELCVHCLENVDNKPTYWKWLVIALHSAMQGAMVCHLSGTAQLGALTKSNAAAWLNHLQNARPIDQPPSREQLANFLELFERISAATNMIEQAGHPIQVTEAEKRSVKKLNGLRRNFVHFSPKGWSIEMSGMPNIIADICSIILKIADDPWPFRHLSMTRKQYLERQARKINRLAKKLDSRKC